MSETLQKICRNCVYFRPEPGVVLDERSAAALVLSALKLDKGGSLQPEYGKCVAKGKFAPQLGVFSPRPCQVTDNAGNLLFAPKTGD